MGQILAVTGPIYLMIAIGYACGRFGVFSRDDFRVLGRFVVTVALPALLFTSLSQQPIGQLLNLRYLGAYLVGSLLAFGLVMWGMLRWRGKSRTLAVLSGMGSSCSNSGYIGYPIAVQVLGPVASIALALNMVVENLLMLPFALALADGSGGHTWQRIVMQTLSRLARNPVILAIVAGVLVSALGLPPLGPFGRTVNMLSLASTSVALFVIGGSLVGLAIGTLLRDVVSVSSAKLLLHPLAVGLVMAIAPPEDRSLHAAGVLFAGMPMLSIFPIIAQRYHHDGFAAAALLVATSMSFVTITVLLWMLHSLLGWI